MHPRGILYTIAVLPAHHPWSNLKCCSLHPQAPLNCLIQLSVLGCAWERGAVGALKANELRLMLAAQCRELAEDPEAAASTKNRRWVL